MKWEVVYLDGVWWGQSSVVIKDISKRPRLYSLMNKGKITCSWLRFSFMFKSFLFCIKIPLPNHHFVRLQSIKWVICQN